MGWFFFHHLKGTISISNHGLKNAFKCSNKIKITVLKTKANRPFNKYCIDKLAITNLENKSLFFYEVLLKWQIKFLILCCKKDDYILKLIPYVSVFLLFWIKMQTWKVWQLLAVIFQGFLSKYLPEKKISWGIFQYVFIVNKSSEQIVGYCV